MVRVGSETNSPERPGGVTIPSRVLCGVYALIAVAALIATWSQNVAYLHSPASFLVDFLTDSKANPGSRSLTVDISLLFLSAGILIVIEARKHGVRFVWAYIIGGFAIAISVTFPLFLIARELRMRHTGQSRVSTADAAALVVFAAVIAGLVVWVDVL
ncbi:Protein of unknown function (DUF2834) [Mycolicibacterium chubuense NBB4]|uniref:DUF2834 domain-containing protein n=1 Tax=Mycolicibacterium chubuense (strain NBB4) TaxID=710421 RepID=I4BHW7_MYCCN|nr:DUF2834 domain-containing protein [Mycolicibacterium chubuense]AFM16874.1 Protein of unknown function (DUF2834) [Mycolicibacterium chubuense NBB4]